MEYQKLRNDIWVCLIDLNYQINKYLMIKYDSEIYSHWISIYNNW